MRHSVTLSLAILFLGLAISNGVAQSEETEHSTYLSKWIGSNHLIEENPPKRKQAFHLYNGFGYKDGSKVLESSFWKIQGLETVMPAWIENGIDQQDGQFYAFLDRKWNPYNEDKKYPGMMSRHLFSYSAAYMMSGKEQYFERAKQLFNYLIKHGWDDQHGGWYYAIDTSGKVVDQQKDLFMNIYAITGLTMYHMMTNSSQAMAYIKKSQSLLKKHAWDNDNGGYYRRLNRNWEPTETNKVFTPQVAPVSGYLLYLYAATKDDKYLDESKKLMNLVSNRMQDEELAWIREKFDKQWNPLAESRSQEEINIGHNIEVSWLWLRLYAITDNTEYQNKASQLYQQLHQEAFKNNGAWLHKMGLTNPERHPETTNWWIQAYGNMLQLAMHAYGSHEKSLKHFRNGTSFWNQAFVDEQFGGTVLSATLQGDIDRGDKAVRTKTSYHAMEHSLLNYLYLKLWVEEEPLTLHFNLVSDSYDKELCTLPVYSSEASVSKVHYSSLNLTNEFSDGFGTCLPLPENVEGPVIVTIE